VNGGEARVLHLPSLDTVLSDLGAEPAGAPTAWREELERVRTEALAQARVEARRELEETRGALQAAIAAFAAAIERQSGAELREVIEFGIALARRVLEARIVVPEERLISIVREVIESGRRDEQVVVQLAPESAERIGSILVAEALEAGMTAVIVPRAGLGPYDAVIEAGARTIDARIEAAFARVLHELEGWRSAP
jgi:flagellar biosynthesis/type III secretory pathway protein FliH